MHFAWDFTFGQVIVSIPILTILYMLIRIHSMLLNFRIEHEWLMMEWAGKQSPPVKVHELPTRQSKWW